MRMVCDGWAMTARNSKFGRGTIRPGGASEEFGNASSSKIRRRRGAPSKKSSSWVTDILSAGTAESSNDLRLDIFFQARLVITLSKRNLCSDERFPPKTES